MLFPHSTLNVRGLSLAYSHTVGRPGQRAWLIRLWEMSWASASHDLYIVVQESLFTDSVSAGPVGGPFLDEGPHEIMHDEEFQMGLVELINTLNNLFYHQPLTDLVLGRTPIHQDLRVKVASLHPALLREHIKGGHSHRILIL